MTALDSLPRLLTFGILFHMSDEKFSDKWRAGFEVEVALGSLGDPRIEDLDEPMDEAEPAFCRAAAEAFSDLTGRRWSAPRRPPKRLGFYVVPEYNLDPLHFPEVVVAGVELITPPLPLDEAEDVRQNIKETLLELEAYFNFERNYQTIDFGWHINLDSDDPRQLDLASFSMTADELAVLNKAGRRNRSFIAPQRHAFGPPMLREFQSLEGGSRVQQNLRNFLLRFSGIGKDFAANFERGRYVEFRHYGVIDFLSSTPLEDIIQPLVVPAEVNRKVEAETATKLARKIDILANWLADVRDQIECRLDDGTNLLGGRSGDILISGRCIGRLLWNGSADYMLYARDKFIPATIIRNRIIADLPEAVALMVLDAAETRLAGFELPIYDIGFSERIDELADRLIAAKLATQEETIWQPWDDED